MQKFTHGFVIDDSNYSNLYKKYKSSAEFIYSQLSDCNKILVVVEGYEMVGKSTMVKNLKKLLTNKSKGKGVQVINQSSDLNHTVGKIIGYDKLYANSLVQFDLINNMSGKVIMICDRGLVSSTFYPSGDIDTYTVGSYINKAFDKVILIRLELDEDYKVNNLYGVRKTTDRFDDESVDEWISNYEKFYSDEYWDKPVEVYQNSVGSKNFMYVRIINKINNKVD